VKVLIRKNYSSFGLFEKTNMSPTDEIVRIKLEPGDIMYEVSHMKKGGDYWYLYYIPKMSEVGWARSSKKNTEFCKVVA